MAHIRVCGGGCRGIHLQVPKGDRVRPTTERVREAIFSILFEQMPGAHVMDLCAGAGSLGIEALSRGAEFACFIDIFPDSIHAIRNNLAACRLTERATLHCGSVLTPTTFARLKQHYSKIFPFHFIFLDPPYHKGMIQSTLATLADREIVHPEGCIVAEHEAELPLHAVGPPWRLQQARRFGDSVVSFWNWQEVAKKN
ncbi:MAG: 16S rRNA (guanine(966)-N(2))-methyltransferase RsmD [Magnetococcus sp. DMHC-6]